MNETFREPILLPYSLSHASRFFRVSHRLFTKIFLDNRLFDHRRPAMGFVRFRLSYLMTGRKLARQKPGPKPSADRSKIESFI
jgi:hypothetical protein